MNKNEAQLNEDYGTSVGMIAGKKIVIPDDLQFTDENNYLLQYKEDIDSFILFKM